MRNHRDQLGGKPRTQTEPNDANSPQGRNRGGPQTHETTVGIVHVRERTLAEDGTEADLGIEAREIALETEMGDEGETGTGTPAVEEPETVV
jgi:hypothetical protein